MVLQDIPPSQIQQGLAVGFLLPAILEEHSQAREEIYHGRKKREKMWNANVQKE